MHLRPLAVAVGTGITLGLAVAVVVIELLAVEFSAIVGLPVGVVAGGVAAVVVAGRYRTTSAGRRAVVDGLAGGGYVVVLGLAVRYVGRLGLRSVVTVPRLVALAAVVGLAFGLASWARRGRSTAVRGGDEPRRG